MSLTIVSRGYDWSSPGIDPRTHRFGVVARDGMNDGVAQSIKQVRPTETKIGSSRVEQVKDALNDPLGRQRNVKGTVRDLPPDFAFGSRAAPIDGSLCIHLIITYSLHESVQSHIGMQ
jgi:hypothetical protein